MKTALVRTLAIMLFISNSWVSAHADNMSQNQTVNIGIANTNSNQNTNTNSATATAAAAAKAKAAAQAKAVAKVTTPAKPAPAKPAPAKPVVVAPKATAKAASNAGAAAGSKATGSAVTSTTSSSSANNQNNLNLQLGQQQNLSNSGNASLSGSGNSSLENSGNSSSNSTLENSGNSTSNSSMDNAGNSNVTVEGSNYVNTYVAPANPVSSAAPSFATVCTQGMSGQTKAIGFSQSSITMQCKYLLDANAQIEWMQTVWNHINTNYATRLERVEVIRERLEIQKVQLESSIAQADLAKGGAASAELQVKLDTCIAKLNRLDIEEARMYQQVDTMVLAAEQAFGRSAGSLKEAHVTINSRSSRVTTFLATAAQNLFASVGFVAIVAGL